MKNKESCKQEHESIGGVSMFNTTNMGLTAINPLELRDIKDVVIDTAASKKERMLSFLEQINNPYLYKCGDVVVKVSFANTETTLEDRLLQHFKSLI